MIKLFRKIRQKLLNEGNLKRYLIYAIGEILLVVIGILIALQINNWNEGRKDKRSELSALIDLKKEFADNRDLFVKQHKSKQELTKSWVQFFRIISDTSHSDSIRAISHGGPGTTTYNPSLSVLESALSTGKIDKIKNDSLKYLITKWKNLLIDFKEDEERHINYWDKEVVVFERYILPEHFYDVRERGQYKSIFYSIDERDNMMVKAYTDLAYQNLLLRNLFFLQQTVTDGEILLNSLSIIVDLLENEIAIKK